jgi:hypothetical protein
VLAVLLRHVQPMDRILAVVGRTFHRGAQSRRRTMASWGERIVTTTRLASMIIEDVDLRSRPSLLAFSFDPMDCDHVWEPHLVETGRAYCPRCGSSARWINDPRITAEAAS